MGGARDSGKVCSRRWNYLSPHRLTMMATEDRVSKAKRFCQGSRDQLLTESQKSIHSSLSHTLTGELPPRNLYSVSVCTVFYLELSNLGTFFPALQGNSYCFMDSTFSFLLYFILSFYRNTSSGVFQERIPKRFIF